MVATNIPQVKIVDCTTGEEIVRDANANEIAQFEESAKNALAEKTQVAKATADKAALLRKLGITAEEAVLLLS